MRKFTAIIACVLCAVCLTFTLSSCDVTYAKVKSNCETSWNISPMESNGENYKFKTRVYITRNSVNIKEIWVNISKTSVENVNLEFVFYSSTESNSTNPTYNVSIPYKKIKNSNKGWICVQTDLNVSGKSNCRIATEGGFVLNEVVFYSVENKKFEISFTDADMVYKDNKGKIVGKSNMTKEELQALNLSGGNPTNIVDEQDKLTSAIRSAVLSNKD